MTDVEYKQKCNEVDELLNDPMIPMRADRVWALLDDLVRLMPMTEGRMAPAEA